MKKDKFFKYEIDTTLLSLLSAIITIILLLIFINPLSTLTKYFNSIFHMILILGSTIIWLILHELLHGIAYRITGTKGKNISYGIALEKGVFYCLSNQEIERKSILISLLTPLTIIGILTLVLGLILNLPILILLSIFNIGGSIGDIVMFIDLIKLEKQFKYTEIGDPTSFLIITKEDLSQRKMFGLKQISNGIYKKETRNIKKITISNQSKVYILLYIIMCTMLYFID